MPLQKSRPSSDISNVGWAPTPLYLQLNEPSPNDGTFVGSSTASPSGNDVFVVRLAALGWPADGKQELTVRLRNTGSAASAVVSLLEGSIWIATRTFQPGASFADYEMTLSEVEKSYITNYSDLRVRVQTGFTVVTTCSQCTQAPKKWTFTILNVSSPCGVYNRTYTLTHDSGCTWKEDFGMGMAILSFSGGIWDLVIGSGPKNIHWTLPAASWNCMNCNLMNVNAASNTTGCTGWPAILNICPGPG